MTSFPTSSASPKWAATFSQGNRSPRKAGLSCMRWKRRAEGIPQSANISSMSTCSLTLGAIRLSFCWRFAITISSHLIYELIGSNTVISPRRPLTQGVRPWKPGLDRRQPLDSARFAGYQLPTLKLPVLCAAPARAVSGVVSCARMRRRPSRARNRGLARREVIHRIRRPSRRGFPSPRKAFSSPEHAYRGFIHHPLYKVRPATR